MLIDLLPKLFAAVGADHVGLKVDYWPLDAAALLQDATKLSSKLLDPIFILHSQVCSASQLLQRSRTDDALTQFTFAWDNLNRFFLCGRRFLLGQAQPHGRAARPRSADPRVGAPSRFAAE
jgi:hypothetical protein